MPEKIEPGTLRYQILQNLQTMDTGELLRIWRRNNREGWTAEAFEVMHGLLLDRLGEVPEQNAPSADDGPDESVGLETESAKDEDYEEDAYHDARKILRIASLAKRASWIVLGLGLALLILTPPEVVMRHPLSRPMLGDILVVLLGYGPRVIGCGVSFIILQATSRGLVHFLQIEINTRPVVQSGD